MKQIEANLALFASVNCSVHIVSFGTKDGALKWQQETNCPFPIWTDEERKFYKVLGFQRSIAKVWKIPSVIFYGAQLAQNVELPKPYTELEDDPLQMAGNVIFNSKGHVVFVHTSQHPADRPSVEDMIEVIKNTGAD